MPEGTDWFKFEWILRNCRDFDVPIEQLDEQELRERFPQLQFAPDHIGVLQPEAMLVNPRRFVAAQLAAAEQQGVTRLDDTVTAVEEHADHVVVHTGGGERLGATNVVLAAGAYLNLQPLSPRRLAFDTYGATLTLGVVADPTTADFPALMYYKMTEENPFAGILAPPLAYPDGTWCIKASGSSLFDTPLDSVEAITAWVRTGGDERDVAPFLALMSEVLPAVVVEEVRLRPCLVTRNVTGDAYVDFVTDRIAVVTEGERGVECGDASGRLAARMIIAGEWDDSLPAAAFAARFGDD
jgi:sarcosine oxidase